MIAGGERLPGASAGLVREAWLTPGVTVGRAVAMSGSR